MHPLQQQQQQQQQQEEEVEHDDLSAALAIPSLPDLSSAVRQFMLGDGPKLSMRYGAKYTPAHFRAVNVIMQTQEYRTLAQQVLENEQRSIAEIEQRGICWPPSPQLLWRFPRPRPKSVPPTLLLLASARVVQMCGSCGKSRDTFSAILITAPLQSSCTA